MAFLNDYFEPTLAILYESTPTWTGQLSKRKDTKSIMVVSLSLNTKTYPILYKLDKLPYNSFSVLPVPSPTGGIVIMGPNGIVHVDQACTPAAVGVNAYFGAEEIWGDRNPLYRTATDKRHLGITLEAAKATFLNSDTLLLVPRSGEMILFDLMGHEDAGRGWKRKRSGVTDFEVTRLGLRGPFPSCLHRVGPWKRGGQLFWGSNVGDSLLLNFTESRNRVVVRKEKTEMDELDNELYGDQPAQTHEVETTMGFKFQVADHFQSLTPIRDMAIGEPVSYSEIQTNDASIDLEIVACTGEAHSGALGVMSRSIRPQIVSSFDMEGVIEMWTVRCAVDKTEYHSYLFLSKENGTLVLKTGQEFSQVKESDFYTVGPTVTVDSVLNHALIAQIEPNNIYLLDSDGKKVNEHAVGSDEVWIVSASILDPFILVLTNLGELTLFQVTDDRIVKQVHEYKVLVNPRPTTHSYRTRSFQLRHCIVILTAQNYPLSAT